MQPSDVPSNPGLALLAARRPPAHAHISCSPRLLSLPGHALAVACRAAIVHQHRGTNATRWSFPQLREKITAFPKPCEEIVAFSQPRKEIAAFPQPRQAIIACLQSCEDIIVALSQPSQETTSRHSRPHGSKRCARGEPTSLGAPSPLQLEAVRSVLLQLFEAQGSGGEGVCTFAEVQKQLALVDTDDVSGVDLGAVLAQLEDKNLIMRTTGGSKIYQI
ncbi:hypothetical protein AB1Y20_013880 [Prymnesium parvum]|uniref:Uncharacterized protein n=1 Tax=Prymnesium parvum TaxID=97485 RepID=A0AB34IGA2_PRYPA